MIYDIGIRIQSKSTGNIYEITEKKDMDCFYLVCVSIGEHNNEGMLINQEVCWDTLWMDTNFRIIGPLVIKKTEDILEAWI